MNSQFLQHHGMDLDFLQPHEMCTPQTDPQKNPKRVTTRKAKIRRVLISFQKTKFQTQFATLIAKWVCEATSRRSQRRITWMIRANNDQNHPPSISPLKCTYLRKDKSRKKKNQEAQMKGKSFISIYFTHKLGVEEKTEMRETINVYY